LIIGLGIVKNVAELYRKLLQSPIVLGVVVIFENKAMLLERLWLDCWIADKGL